MCDIVIDSESLNKGKWLTDELVLMLCQPLWIICYHMSLIINILLT